MLFRKYRGYEPSAENYYIVWGFSKGHPFVHFFGMNILTLQQQDLFERFARKETGIPLFDEALAHYEESFGEISTF